MREKKNQRINVPVTPSELETIKKRAQQANMSSANYIRIAALSNEQIVFINKSGIIIDHLGNICSEIQNLKYDIPTAGEHLKSIEKEVMELWHLLR